MKKILSLFLSTIICISLMGCKDDVEVENTTKEYVPETEILQVYTNPEKYKGKFLKVKGKIFTEIQEYENIKAFQMFGDAKNSEQNTIVYARTNKDLKEGDFIMADGKIEGSFDGKNAYGASINAIELDEAEISSIEPKEVFAPTIEEKNIDQTSTQNNIYITVSKIEFAKNETRVYVRVKNNSNDEFEFWEYESKILQENKQFDFKDDFDYEYKRISDAIYPNIEDEGMLIFPAIDRYKPFTLVFDGSSEDYMMNFKKFKIEVN